ncbi:MAG: hypothetical protein ACXABY_05930, partial [Candidatus Thorarchaeota archaeon]
ILNESRAGPGKWKVTTPKVDGKHGPYAVACRDGNLSITFSLKPPVWNEEDPPGSGQYVFLSDLRLKEAGWRAHSARFWRPEDEQAIQSTEQSAEN